MADIDDALTWNELQGNDDWTELSTDDAGKALARANAYMALKYRFRANLVASEIALISQARYRIALDLVINGPLPARYTGQVVRTLSKLTGLEKLIDYAPVEGQIDPYPDITSILYPVLIRNSVANYAIGAQPVAVCQGSTAQLGEVFTYAVGGLYDPYADTGI